MIKSPRVPLAILAFTALVCAWPASPRSRSSTRPMYAEMDAASQRYARRAIRVQAGDDASLAALSKALEDLEEVTQRCLKTRAATARA
jgi:hypothetical protein